MREPVRSDLVPLACRGVTLVTRVTERSVVYEVWVGSGATDLETDESRLAWNRAVNFGATGAMAAYRGGGASFRLVAATQDRVARAYLEAAKGMQ